MAKKRAARKSKTPKAEPESPPLASPTEETEDIIINVIEPKEETSESNSPEFEVAAPTPVETKPAPVKKTIRKKTTPAPRKRSGGKKTVVKNEVEEYEVKEAESSHIAETSLASTTNETPAPAPRRSQRSTPPTRRSSRVKAKEELMEAADAPQPQLSEPQGAGPSLSAAADLTTNAAHETVDQQEPKEAVLAMNEATTTEEPTLSVPSSAVVVKEELVEKTQVVQPNAISSIFNNDEDDDGIIIKLVEEQLQPEPQNLEPPTLQVKVEQTEAPVPVSQPTEPTNVAQPSSANQELTIKEEPLEPVKKSKLTKKSSNSKSAKSPEVENSPAKRKSLKPESSKKKPEPTEASKKVKPEPELPNKATLKRKIKEEVDSSPKKAKTEAATPTTSNATSLEELFARDRELREYIHRTVFKAIVASFVVLDRERPADPLTAMADFLSDYAVKNSSTDKPIKASARKVK